MANNPDYIPPSSGEGNQPPSRPAWQPNVIQTPPSPLPSPRPASTLPTPPPPPPSRPIQSAPQPATSDQDVGIRTMTGDMTSLRASGGLESEPKMFKPKDLLGNEPIPAPQMPPEGKERAAHSKALFTAIGVVGGIVVLGVIGYLFVLPMLNKAPIVTPPPAEPITTTEPISPVEPTPPVEPPTPPPFEHKTLFPSASSVGSQAVALEALTADSVAASLKSATGQIAVGSLTEIAFAYSGAAIQARQLIGALLPGSSSSIETDIEEDFTAFIYKDANGSWPGYVLSLTDAATAQSGSKVSDAIKASPKVFYLDDPGNPKSASFNDGAKLSPNTTSVQYLQYSQPGASFNIATMTVGSENYLVISTSYNGIKEAVKALGF